LDAIGGNLASYSFDSFFALIYPKLRSPRLVDCACSTSASNAKRIAAESRREGQQDPPGPIFTVFAVVGVAMWLPTQWTGWARVYQPDLWIAAETLALFLSGFGSPPPRKVRKPLSGQRARGLRVVPGWVERRQSANACCAKFRVITKSAARMRAEEITSISQPGSQGDQQ